MSAARKAANEFARAWQEAKAASSFMDLLTAAFKGFAESESKILRAEAERLRGENEKLQLQIASMCEEIGALQSEIHHG